MKVRLIAALLGICLAGICLIIGASVGMSFIANLILFLLAWGAAVCTIIISCSCSDQRRKAD